MDAGNSESTATQPSGEGNASQNTNTQSGSSVSAKSSFRDQVLAYSQKKQEGKSNLADGKSEQIAKSSESPSEIPSSQLDEENIDQVEQSSDDLKSENPSEEEIEKDLQKKPWFQQRIDKLTAKYKSEQEAHKTLALESAKKDEAIRILQEELERIASKANLDPHEEQIQELKLQHRIDQLNNEIPSKIEAQWAEKLEEIEVQEKAREIVNNLKSAVAKYQGLFTENELLSYMRQSGYTDASQVKIASEKLYKERLAAAQKFISTSPMAPSTAAGLPSSNRELSTQKKYASIKEYAEDMKNQRAGRLK